MEENNDYFDTKTEAEKLNNVSDTVKSIISKKTEPVVIQPTNEIDPIVDLVNQSLSTPHSTGLLSKHKPRSIFTPQ